MRWRRQQLHCWNWCLFRITGVVITSITPISKLVVEHHLKKYPKLAQRYLLLWEENYHIHLWVIAKGSVLSWEVIAAEPVELLLSSNLFC
ncbi:MAG: hypothetical protein R3C11_24645 [Planctomycetaceae bacterium]